MRLLYQYIAHNLGKKKCRLILDGIKGGVAVSLKQNQVFSHDYIYSFLTTSRPVEKWLQRTEEQIIVMASKKVQIDLSMIIGGYGAGKTHIKEYITRKEVKNIFFLKLNIASMIDMNKTIAISDVFSFILLNTKSYLDKLYDELLSSVKKDDRLSPRDLDDSIKEILKEHLVDNQFIKAFCSYGGLGNDRGDFKPLEDFLLKSSRRIFLPLMKMYKKYLNMKGLCIFVDEFEDLQHLNPDKRSLFVGSIRTLYDEIAESFDDKDLPSFKIIILCTLSFWNEIITDTRSQALETRVDLFEIPPLVEDEIMAIAEKLHALYKKSGYLKSEVIFDSNKLQRYLVGKAGLESPLTPRFVIEQLVKIVEFPEDYIKYLYQPE